MFIRTIATTMDIARKIKVSTLSPHCPLSLNQTPSMWTFIFPRSCIFLTEKRSCWIFAIPDYHASCGRSMWTDATSSQVQVSWNCLSVWTTY